MKEIEDKCTTMSKTLNINELEHRLIDKIERVNKETSEKMAEKFEMSKRFRILEHTMRATQDLLMRTILTTPGELVGILSSLGVSNMRGAKKVNITTLVNEV